MFASGPAAASIDVAGALRRRVGFVFQSFNVIERANVFDNVLWGSLGRQHGLGALLGRFPESDRRLAMEAIAEVDLLEQIAQRVDTLSGGQQQRVGAARVIVQQPELVLADEPVSSLDLRIRSATTGTGG